MRDVFARVLQRRAREKRRESQDLLGGKQERERARDDLIKEARPFSRICDDKKAAGGLPLLLPRVSMYPRPI